MLVDKDRKLLDNKVQVLRPTILPPGIEVQVYCRLLSKSSRPVEHIKNCIRGDRKNAVVTTVCRHGRERRTLTRCINVTAKLQVLRAGRLIDISLPLDED